MLNTKYRNMRVCNEIVLGLCSTFAQAPSLNAVGCWLNMWLSRLTPICCLVGRTTPVHGKLLLSLLFKLVI